MNTTSFNTNLIDTIREYDLLQDRLPGDSMSLPNQWNDIKINPNEYILGETINYSLESLHKNWLYLLAYSVIPTNDIPNARYVNDIIIDRGSGVEWNTLDNEFRNQISILDGVQHLIKVQNQLQQQDYNLIAATNTNVILLSGSGTVSVDIIVNADNLGRDPIMSNSSVTHPSNGIMFQNIQDIIVNQDTELFVLDAHHKTIFKFDISGIITLDDAVLKNDTPGRLLTEMVGGTGDIQDKIKFKSPVCLVSVQNNIYVLDTDPSTNTTVVKRFDSHLNWLGSYDLGTVDSQSVLHMNYSSLDDQFYIISNDVGNSTSPRITKYTVDFDFESQHDLMDFYKHDAAIADETYKKIYFSLENDNIMYIVTDKNVYKKYASRPESFIGRFKLNERQVGPLESNRNISDITIFQTYVTNGDQRMQKDEILLFENYNNTIYKFLEDSGFENSFESSVDDKMLSFDDIKIESEENIDSIVYNKAFYKLLYNNFILLENISRKFATYYDNKGISQYVGFRYLNSDELNLLIYELSLNNYVSSNELIVSDTINRCLKLVLDLQMTILSNMREKSINVYPDPNKTIVLN